MFGYTLRNKVVTSWSKIEKASNHKAGIEQVSWKRIIPSILFGFIVYTLFFPFALRTIQPFLNWLGLAVHNHQCDL